MHSTLEHPASPPAPVRCASYRPKSEEIGALYDHLGPLYATIWEGDIHVGVWNGDDDDATMTEAQDRLTDMMIERTPVREGERVLDVGCGTGKPARRLAVARECAVVGVTVSRWQVETARAETRRAGLEDRVRFEHADAMALPFEDSSFDAVWAFESLQHMPDFGTVLSEMTRVVRPGGHVVLTDIVNEVPLDETEKEMFFPILGVSTMISKEHYPAWLEHVGLEPLEVVDLGAAIERTIDVIMRRIEAEREALSQVYDEEFLAQMDAAWDGIGEIHRQKMGYVLAAARRPG